MVLKTSRQPACGSCLEGHLKAITDRELATETLSENEEKYKIKCKDVYDRKAKERKFEIGDLELVRNLDRKIHGFSQELSGLYACY